MSVKLSYRYKKFLRIRYFVVFIFFLALFSLLLARLFYLQILRHPHYSAIAEDNRTVIVSLPSKRGLIYDRNLTELSMNVPKYSLYAIPRFILDKEYTAGSLASALNKDKETVLGKISSNKMFVWIKRKLSDEEVKRINMKHLVGIDFISENERSYPNNSLAAHVLGFVDIDNNGLEGIERYYDKELQGAEGYKIALVDAMKREVESLDKPFLPPRDGYGIVLTIDEVIQHLTEKALLDGVEKFHPKSASVVVMDPSNGDILALCNWPTFDLNRYMSSTPNEIRNRAITDLFEPGSAFKIVTANGVLEEKLVGPDDTFDCENGQYRIAGRLLHDHRPHGVLKFKNIIEVSSNIGIVKIAQKLGKEKLHHYMRLFGFGKETGIDFPGEVKGIVRHLSEWSAGSIAAVPIGQEVAVTTIQLAVAISCIANDGILMKPRVAKCMVDGKKNLIKEFGPQLRGRVFSKETCLEAKKMLRMVVDSGTGKRASVPGYTVAGKTGTAQRLESDGSYSHDKFNSIFIGFAPVGDPKLAIAVVFIEPHPYYYGGVVAAPIFSEIADKTLRYLGIPSDSSKGEIVEKPNNLYPTKNQITPIS